MELCNRLIRCSCSPTQCGGHSIDCVATVKSHSRPWSQSGELCTFLHQWWCDKNTCCIASLELTLSGSVSACAPTLREQPSISGKLVPAERDPKSSGHLFCCRDQCFLSIHNFCERWGRCQHCFSSFLQSLKPSASKDSQVLKV